MLKPPNGQNNKPFSLLIKPASADCNLKCQYCFYLDRCSLYPDSPRHRMSDTVLEQMVAGYMATNQPVYTFGWQGGEPTLMGTAFFRKVTALQQQYGKKGSHVANGLQTNATLIDDEMAALFAEYNFLLGVSLDGPADIHDYYRRNKSGSGSHQDVLKGIGILKRHDAAFNILTLVNDVNVKRGKEVYTYLRDNGFHYHQYIPCVEFDERGALLPYAVDADAWGGFLCDIFDEWVKKDTHTVSVRLFDAILGLMVQGSYNICHMAGNCCQYFVVEHNGDIYPCDFFVTREKRLGSIMEASWEDMLSSPSYIEFGSAKSDWSAVCSACSHLNYCSGDCLKHRVTAPGTQDATSRLCSGWKRFFDHALPWFKEEAARIQKHRQQASKGTHSNDFALFPSFTVGRNDACFCGSGKKYKKCHGLMR